MPISSLRECLRIHALQKPQKIAIKDSFRSLTYLELYERTKRLSHVFQKRKREGCSHPQQQRFVVGFLSSNRIEPVEVYLAALFSGTMVAPVNPTLQPLEMIPVIRNSSPKVIFVENGICYDRLREALSSLQLEFEETQQGKDEKNRTRREKWRGMAGTSGRFFW